MINRYFVIAALLGTALIAGCQNNKDRVAFDGKYFRAKVGKVDGQRDVITVTVRDVSQSLDGARAAGRFEAVSYCVKNFGSSDIAWTVGPDTPTPQLQIADNTLVLQGTCPQ